MKSLPLKAYPRTLTRRGGAKKLRAQGRVPAVIYGRSSPPQNLELDARELVTLLHRAAAETLLVDLSVAGDPRPNRLALVQEVQHHPLSGQVLHVDLHEVSETEKVTVMVPVEPVGEAVGVKSGGGVLEHVLFKLKVRALPKDLPEVLRVDVSHLGLGQTIHLGDIQPPPGVEILGDKQLPVFSVAAPITEEKEAAVAAEPTAPGEVEMIKEKKEAGAEPEATAKPPAEKAAAAAAKPAEKPGEAKPEKKAAEPKPEKKK
jgi:large subunit ribosomal protein L25